MSEPCPHCGTLKVERNGYCATFNFEQRKADRTTTKKATPIKKVSDKRRDLNQVYARIRKSYMDVQETCEVCKIAPATECHHMRGRGEFLLNTDYFLAVCSPCHRRITEDSAWAISMGYSYLRTATI